MIFKLRRWAAPALLQLVSPVVRGSPWPGSGALGHWARRAGGNSTQARELSSAADEPPSACRVGICFDIDGVFKYGGAYHPHGASLLRKVAAAGVPYVFMTNGGGGRTEDQYAAELESKLLEAEPADVENSGVPIGITTEQMVLSYSPFNEDLGDAKDTPLLIVGDPKEKVMNVARSYGLSKAVHISDYSEAHPLMNPFRQEDIYHDVSSERWDEGIKGVCVFTDPKDFFEGCQLVIDVLLSSRPGEIEYEPEHEIPVYFSNPDLLWKTQYPQSRFGQGAFRLALERLYEARLESLGLSTAAIAQRMEGWMVQYGKPEVVQHKYALRLLQRNASDTSHDGSGALDRVYMVGDNIDSDMAGCIKMNAANAAGAAGAATSSNSHDVGRGETTTEEWIAASREPGNTTGADAAPLSVDEWVAAQGAGGAGSEGAGGDSPPWRGVLVRTGVYTEGGDTGQATVVVDDVEAAVDWIIDDDRYSP